MLERLGMRSRVTRSAVLQSARSIEELAASDAPAAARRARALLRYVDQNAEAIPAVFGFFVGQVIKESGGQANPGMVNQILRSKLDGA